MNKSQRNNSSQKNYFIYIFQVDPELRTLKFDETEEKLTIKKNIYSINKLMYICFSFPWNLYKPRHEL